MTTPDWLDRELYPFASHYFDVVAGRMHYVDEGAGEVLVMTHGLPTWSFLNRHLIRGLQDQYRVIAPDNLGFGLSDRPTDHAYHPRTQAAYLDQLIDGLGLKDITLVLHDFGGPIGFSYALNHPGNVKRLVIFNTWMWSMKADFTKRLTGWVINSPIGRRLYTRMGFEMKVIFPSVFADKSVLTPAVRQHYTEPVESTYGREVVYQYAQQLLGASDWYTALWEQRAAIADIPALLVWGMRDPVIGKANLQRFQELFSNITVKPLPDTGHYVQEEQGQAIAPMIAEFMQTT